jgi:undecaprenyl-diphosphatase
MMTIIQAIILGLLQGVTELFPISSLGHSVIFPRLFGWDIGSNDKYFLLFLVATHFATALVLFGFFWRDWIAVFKGLWRVAKTRTIGRTDTYAKLGLLLVIGSIPAGILGLVFEKPIRGALVAPSIAAFFLIVNGIVLLVAESLRKKANSKYEDSYDSDKQISRLKWASAFGIGAAQALALIPGISRSGASMAGGLKAGLSNESAARFSFLLATPIIGAAALLKLPELFHHDAAPMRGAIIAGALAAALAAYVSVRFLVKFFQTHSLKPFAYYCMIAGFVFSVWLMIV